MSTSTSSLDSSPSEQVMRNVGTVLGSTFTIVGITGNLLVIFIILRFPRMRTVPNVYIFCIACSDLLLLAVAPFIIHFYHVGQWTFEKGFCECQSCIEFTSIFAGFFLVSAFNVERYQVIAHPLESRQRQSLKNASLICLSVFFLAFLTNLPLCVTSYVVEEVVEGRNVTVCRYFWPGWGKITESKETTRRLYLSSLGFLLPLCLNATLYGLIIRNLWKQNDFHSTALRKHGKDSATTVTKMAALVTASFIVFTGPFHMYSFISALSNIEMPEYVGMWTIQLCFGNGALDPIIYALMGTNFRECMKQLFCRRPPVREAKTRRNEADSSYSMNVIE